MGVFGKKRSYRAIDPDEILLDAANIPGYDAARLEGRLEKPIEPRAFASFVIVAGVIALVFIVQLVRLQVVDAATFADRAERNRLAQNTLVADRGLIEDRNGIPLAENIPQLEREHAARVYPLGAAAAHVVGYVSYPRKDRNGYWIQSDTRGLSGVESMYDGSLKGENGVQIQETDAHGAVVSGSIVRDPVRGETLPLALDSGLQKELYESVKQRADDSGFNGGSAVIMDVHTGEVYALVSYPSFDPGAVSAGDSSVSALLTDPRSPFLDRAVAGLYAPGSVVKTMVAAAALEENIISPQKKILSTGSLVVPNPYDPTRPTVFKDWKAHGWVDMRQAIAVSSDVYFYEVGGGFEEQPGLGIARIKEYLTAFGLGVGTGIGLPGEQQGVIPDPAWKAKAFDGERWLLGDTYNTSIGQYGFQVTAIELARASAAIANGGTLVTPTLRKNEQGAQVPVGVSDAHLQIVREGMLLATKPGGTATAFNIPGMVVGGKTGTAQVGVRNEFVNSTVIGFFPYENPRFAFAAVMERGKAGTQMGSPAMMARVLTWIVANRGDMLH